MWNAPLINGTGLSIATGCALVLLGLSLGLLVAGLCLAFVAASSDRQANLLQEYGATISDDEIELVIELVGDAVAGSGWTLCGDCYTRKLLVQLPLPPAVLLSGQEDLALHSHSQRHEVTAVKTASGSSSVASVERLDTTRKRPGRSKSTHRVELLPPLAHPMPESGKNRPEQHLCEEQVYPQGRVAPPSSLGNERNAS